MTWDNTSIKDPVSKWDPGGDERSWVYDPESGTIIILPTEEAENPRGF